MAKRKAKKSRIKKNARKPRRKESAKRTAAKRNVRTRKRQRRVSANSTAMVAPRKPRGRGSLSAGQSGDTQGLPAAADVDSQSVEELVEEGQSFEAGVLSGVENATNADQREGRRRAVRTREVPEDDVPEEYRNSDD